MISVSRGSRRQFLKRTALGAAGTLVAPSIVRAAPRALTMMHESSFIPPFDAMFKGAIASAVITGKRDAISPPVNEAMYVSGLAHVLSISG